MANIRPEPRDIEGRRSYIRHIDLEPILYNTLYCLQPLGPMLIFLVLFSWLCQNCTRVKSFMIMNMIVYACLTWIFHNRPCEIINHHEEVYMAYIQPGGALMWL